MGAPKCKFVGVVDRGVGKPRPCRNYAQAGKLNCHRHQLEERISREQ